MTVGVIYLNQINLNFEGCYSVYKTDCAELSGSKN